MWVPGDDADPAARVDGLTELTVTPVQGGAYLTATPTGGAYRLHIPGGG